MRFFAIAGDSRPRPTIEEVIANPKLLVSLDYDLASVLLEALIADQDVDTSWSVVMKIANERPALVAPYLRQLAQRTERPPAGLRKFLKFMI